MEVAQIVNSFIHSFIPLFVLSFIHRFIHSFVHSFIHSFIAFSFVHLPPFCHCILFVLFFFCSYYAK